ncbi:MAG: hypothetical protein HY738_17480 [Bacteroidia bacterium]|nr:hypothetical protein [Bacteroidia bacterium]
MKTNLNILLIALILCFNFVYGQPGTLDSTFGVSGIVTTHIRCPGDDHGNSVATA